MKTATAGSKQRRGVPAGKPRSKAALEPVRDAERTRQQIIGAARQVFINSLL